MKKKDSRLKVLFVLHFLLLGLIPNIKSQDSIYTVNIMNGVFPEAVPRSWFAPPISLKYTSLVDSETQRVTDIFFRFLGKYRGDHPGKYLRNIVFLHDFEVYGGCKRSFFAAPTFLICDPGLSNGATDVYLERLLHEGYCSILWDLFGSKVFQNEWISLNPKGLNYWPMIEYLIVDGTHVFDIEERLGPAGFMTLLGMTSFLHDFTSITIQLFTPSDRFWKMVDGNPIIQKKVNMAIEFYSAIDSIYTPQFFKQRIPRN